ncbi:hypothetical protein GNI_108380 [Gregarina niphandrodes]|uniref:Transmembrane protein n=1 Tax=Gregarina niphandrodes TaxID=110365 RepID=A0A023B3P2_GRENI|nr:hypothetical protein GNI_108380 [Gregarina niphandrodes]EZG55814.1 hypothetical protein GNI_108380 [Gregarina niphandrodes]|eukprot:XP_011131440.1 hypothetical protein GNI_108380 [Gregarina niphandrodes]
MWGAIWLLCGWVCIGKYFAPEYADRAFRTVEVGFDAEGWYQLGPATLAVTGGSGGGPVRNGTGAYVAAGVGASGGVAVADHFVSERTGDRVPRESVAHTEFPAARMGAHTSLGGHADVDAHSRVCQKGVGPLQVFGSSWDYHKMSYVSATDYVVHVEELRRPHVYCAGARYKKSFFVAASGRETVRDNSCVRGCYSFCGARDFDCDPVTLAAQSFMVYCRVPITTVFAASLMATVFAEGPVGTVVLPRHAFPPGTVKAQIVDVLLKVSTAGPPADPAFEADRFRSTIPDDVNNTARYQDLDETTTATTATLTDLMGHGRAPGQDNRNRFNRLPSQDRRGFARGTRSIDNAYTTPYVFWNDAISLLPADTSAPQSGTQQSGAPQSGAPQSGATQNVRSRPDYSGQTNVTVVGAGQTALRVRAAASHHYGMYDTNNFRYATNTGYYADEVRVVEMPTPTTAVLDVGDTVRRLFESGRLEFSLLGSSNLLAAEPRFVFHLANDWLYYVPDATDTCRKQTSMRKCLYHKCNWCGHVAHADDWALAAWAQHTGLRRLGNCGVPVDVCYLKKGVPTKAFVKS